MKKLVFIGLVVVAGFIVWKMVQTPERYLRNATRDIIKTAQEGSPLSAGAKQKSLVEYKKIAGRVERVIRYIHFDIIVKAEYEGQIHTSRSLNEFRQLLSLWFAKGVVSEWSHKNLSIHVEESQTQGRADFDISFKKDQKRATCKVSFAWWKEAKKWRVKNITLDTCQAI